MPPPKNLHRLHHLNIDRWKKRNPRSVTPKMLVKSMILLTESQPIGVYFTPGQVARVIARKYPWVEQDPELLLREVKDKLVCAAAADILGFKLDSGYYVLSGLGRAVRIDSRSELTFWMMYKKILEERELQQKKDETK